MLYGDFLREKYHNLEITGIVDGVPPLTLTKSKGKPLKDYKIYGDSIQTRLPQKYQEVEYIQSQRLASNSGTYIKTGITGTNITNMKAYIDYSCSSQPGSNSDGNIYWLFATYNNNDLRFGYIIGRTYYKSLMGSAILDTPKERNTSRHTAQLDFTVGAETAQINIDGTDYTLDTSETIRDRNSISDEIYIFGSNYNHESYPYGVASNARIYALKFEMNGVLIRDYVPCYRKSDNEIGLYDLVEGKFYSNDGTGVFQKGNDVTITTTPDNPVEIESCGDLLIPNEYQEVEYIESTGTEYIDTGVIPSNTIGFELKLSLTNVTTDRFLFGDRKGTNGRFNIGIVNSKYYPGWDSISNSPITPPDAYVNIPNIVSQNFMNDRLFKKDGIAYRENLPTLNTIHTETMIAFGRRSSGVISTSEQTIYYIKISDGENLVRDLVPCYRKSDNVIGMYDLVEGKFYTNSGTGTFIKGNDVNHYKIPIIVNLFNKNNPNIFGGYMSNGKLQAYSTSVGQHVCFSVPCRPNTTYIITRKIKGARFAVGSTSYDIASNIPLTKSKGADALMSTELTTGASDKNLIVWFRNGSLSPDNLYTLQQMIEGMIVEEPNTRTNIYLNEPLRKVGDYTDYIDFKRQKVVRNVGMHIYTGDETISVATTYIKSDACDGYILLNDAYNNGGRQYNITMCNTFKATDTNIWNYTGRVNQFTQNTNQFHFNIDNELLGVTDYEAETTTTIKEKIEVFFSNRYLRGEPVITVYPLKTQSEKPIDLPPILTSKDTCILSVGTTVQPSKMYCEYIKR